MNDTDSICLTIEPILQKLQEPFLINNEINPVVYKIAEEIKKDIDQQINNWAKTDLNSNHSTYEFKRENISSAGAFIKKKHYILNIRDDDDKKVDKFKYTGVEVVKTSTPKKLKPLIKNAIQNIIKEGDPKQIEKILKNIYDQYQSFSIEEIAIPVSLNGYEKYYAKIDGFKTGKGTPCHVKSAIYYNLMLQKLELVNKYETLKSGNKIRHIYLLPNSYNIPSIAFLNNLPDELKIIFKPDMAKMFEKTVLNPIQRILTAINWEIKNPLADEKVDLLDILT